MIEKINYRKNSISRLKSKQARIGSHCIPVDPHYLFWKAKKFGISANFIKLAAETNLMS